MKLIEKFKKNKQHKENIQKLDVVLTENKMIEGTCMDLIENSWYANKWYQHDLELYGKIFKKPDEFAVYVQKDKELTKKAKEEGFDSYLWDTDVMCHKLERHFEEVDATPGHDYYIKYLAVMPKFVESDQITNIFLRFYQKNEIDYNEKIFNKDIYHITLDEQEPPLLSVLKWYIKNTKEVPYLTYILAHGYISQWYTTSSLRDMKPSEDGLSLVPCSHYEFNEITGNHWDNLTDEEQDAEIAKMNEETDAKLRAKGLIP